MEPTCPRCKGLLRPQEALAYAGVCEDCWGERQPESQNRWGRVPELHDEHIRAYFEMKQANKYLRGIRRG